MSDANGTGTNGQPENEQRTAPENGYRPTPMNYDYVWGSNQDQYMRLETDDEEEALEQLAEPTTEDSEED